MLLKKQTSFVIVLLLFALQTTGFGQDVQDVVTIRGKIIDVITKEPISFASIYDLKSRKGTISNEQGEFELKLTSMADALKVNHVNYKQIEINAFEAYNVIELSIAGYTLNEVIVTNDALHLVKEAINKSLETVDQIHYSKAFYQKIAKVGKNYTAIHEMFFNSAWNCFGIQELQPTEARYARKNEVRTSFSSIATISFMFTGPINRIENVGRVPNVVGEIEKYYDFRIKNVLNEGTAEETLIVNCISKLDKKEPHFDGVIYIKSTTSNIVKIEGKAINFLTFHKKDPAKNSEIDIELNFIEDINGRSLPIYLHFVLTVDEYRVPLVKNELIEEIKILFYDHNNSKFSGLKATTFRDDLSVIKNTKYNPDFWRENSVVKRTSVEQKIIQSFEKEEHFGNIFK